MAMAAHAAIPAVRDNRRDGQQWVASSRSAPAQRSKFQLIHTKTMLGSPHGNLDRRTPMTLATKGAAEADWRGRLRRDGYAQFPNLCPAPLVWAARAAID